MNTICDNPSANDLLEMASSHYENFPVASWLLPKKLRKPIAVIYAFARSADDLADEGEMSQSQRLQALEHFEQQLDRITNKQSVNEALFVMVAEIVKEYQLPVQYFKDLVAAFKQDVIKSRYENFSEVLNYCKYSANPVGRLLLFLVGKHQDPNLQLSDNICSALQLINFWQDVASDYKDRDRIYIPQDEMVLHNISEQDLAQANNSENYHKLVDLQIDRTAQLLKAGKALGRKLPGRFGLEIRCIIHSGSRVLNKLKHRDDYFQRPVLTKSDLVLSTIKSILG